MSETTTRKQPVDPALPVPIRVVRAVADAKGVATEELQPLHESMDLEALETVVAAGDDTLSVRWSVDGHTVEVGGTGVVRVE